MNNEQLFDEFKQRILPEVSAVIKHLKTDIDPDCIDEPDDTPSIQLTISTNDKLEYWSYQSGDNSYTGSCYGDPHWGVSYITEDCDPNDTANEIIENLADQWFSNK